MNDREEVEREIICRIREINTLSSQIEDLILGFREVLDNYSIWNNSNTINADLDDVYVPCVRGSRHGRNFEMALTSRQIGEGGISFTELDGINHSLSPKLIEPGLHLEDKPIEPPPIHKNRTSYKFLDTWGNVI